jgi:hypothetical protein
MADNEKSQLTERMNKLAGELANLDPDDPRWAEIVREMSRLSLLSASAKGRATDG